MRRIYGAIYIGRGQVLTRIDKRGACIAVDETGAELPEEVRIAQILQDQILNTI
jgi:multidrug resistance efflux pump